MLEIWQSRNNLKYDKTILTQQTITHKINNQKQNIVKTHYKKHKCENTYFNKSPA